MTDYLAQIATAKTRHQAATLLRAWGCSIAAGLPMSTAADRIETIDKCELHAQTLERDYSLDGDSPCSDADHPWRAWLRAWGYAQGEIAQVVGLAGVDELRCAVDWANWQDEHEHDGLTAEQILARYRAARDGQ